MQAQRWEGIRNATPTDATREWLIEAVEDLRIEMEIAYRYLNDHEDTIEELKRKLEL